ncbi:MAG: hypothetical protein RLZZ299_835 [Pseudomonadota bacterium]
MRRPMPAAPVVALLLTGCQLGAQGPGTVGTGTDGNLHGAALLDAVRARVVPQAGPNLTPLQQCNLDEERLVGVDASLLRPLRAALQAKDLTALAALGAHQVAGLPGALPDATRTEGGVHEHAWPAEVSAGVGDYLSQFSSLEDVQLDTWKVVTGPRAADGSYDAATLTLGFDLRGKDSAGWRRNDRGQFEAKVSKGTNGAWTLSALRVTRGETVRAERASFTDVTASSGVNAVTTYPRIEAIRRGGYAIATGDYDKDGHVDMYVGAWGAGTLLRGDGKGGWAPVDHVGLGGETLVKTAIFADLDKDGWEDLFLVRFTPDGSEDLVAYRNHKGTFAKSGTTFTGRVPAGHAMPAAVADFNNDGFLDLYVGYPGAKDFTVIEPVTQTRAVQGMLLNDGKGGFSDTTKASFVGENPTTLYAHSVLAADYDSDGDSDLVVIDDRGGLSPVYQNKGDGTFTQVAKDIGVGNEGFGMGVAIGDLDGDGDEDFVMTNVDFVAGHRYAESCQANWGTSLPSPVQRGLRAFRNLGGGTFEEITDEAGLSWPGEGLAGAEVVDYDNDGDLDLYVATGLWSGTSRDQDLSSLFVRAYGERVKWGESAALLTYQPEKDVELKDWYQKQTENPSPHRMESQSTFMRVLQEYQGDLSAPGTGDSVRPSMAGYEHNRLFRNDGTGHFVEVGYLAGVDSMADGYVIARTDYDRDGRMDLVLRNGDPGSMDHTFAPVQVFHNESDNARSLTLTLEGDSSNPHGIGAFVDVVVGGRTFTRQLLGNNGTAQSEKVLHLGLAEADHAERVIVRWPSGRTQELRNVAAGRHTVREADAPATANAAR